MTCEQILTTNVTTSDGQTIKSGTKVKVDFGPDDPETMEGVYYKVSIDGGTIYEGCDAPGHVPGGPTQFLGMIGDQLL